VQESKEERKEREGKEKVKKDIHIEGCESQIFESRSRSRSNVKRFWSEI
jgi:hypothetical protein